MFKCPTFLSNLSLAKHLETLVNGQSLLHRLLFCLYWQLAKQLGDGTRVDTAYLEYNFELVSVAFLNASVFTPEDLR